MDIVVYKELDLSADILPLFLLLLSVSSTTNT